MYTTWLILAIKIWAGGTKECSFAMKIATEEGNNVSSVGKGLLDRKQFITHIPFYQGPLNRESHKQDHG